MDMNDCWMRLASLWCFRMMVGVGLWLTPTIGRAEVTFEPLHVFTGNPEGSGPEFAPLVQAADGNFYGVTTYGGTTDNCVTGSQGVGCGTIFRMTPEGDVTTLYSFTGESDGANPTGALIQADDS